MTEASQCVEACNGCKRIQEDTNVCGVYSAPVFRWSFGICPMATHKKVEEKVDDKKVNPLKASKRGGKQIS